MKTTITIYQDNGAFDGWLWQETDRILKNLARDFENSWGGFDASQDITIRDINGNRLGHVKFSGHPRVRRV